MATPVWEAGKNYGVSFTPTGGSSVSLNVTDHTWMEQVDSLDVTHTGASGIQAVIAGILRGSGTIKAVLDSANLQTDTATGGFRAGTKGVLRHNITATKYYSVPLMITQVTSTVPVAGAITLEAQVTLDSISGSYAYPT